MLQDGSIDSPALATMSPQHIPLRTFDRRSTASEVWLTTFPMHLIQGIHRTAEGLTRKKHNIFPLDWTWPLPTYRRMRYPVETTHWHLHEGEGLRPPTPSGGLSHPHLRLSKVSDCRSGSLQKCCLKLLGSAACHQPIHAPVSNNPLAHQATWVASLICYIGGPSRWDK